MSANWTPNRAAVDRGLARAVRAIVLPLGRIFYRVAVAGAEHLPATGGMLFVCNHVSYADTIPLSLASRRAFRFTSFEGLFSVPLLGRGLRAFGSIPVDPQNAREAIRRMTRCLAAGESVLLFPEGRLTLDGRTQEIKGGYELVARKAGCPVVMVRLEGMWGSIFSFEGGRWFFKWPRPWRRTVTVTFSRPHAPGQATPDRLEDFWGGRGMMRGTPGFDEAEVRP